MDGTPREILVRMEELRAIGLDAPHTVELLHGLREDGFDVPPKATSSSTTLATIWLSGFWNTMPTRRRISRSAASARVSMPSTQTLPPPGSSTAFRPASCWTSPRPCWTRRAAGRCWTR